MKGIILIIFLGCGADEVTLRRYNISEWESYSINRDDYVEVGYIFLDDSVANYLAYYWLPWRNPEVKDLALGEYAFMFAIDLKIKDKWIFDCVFWDTDFNGTLDSLVHYSGYCRNDLTRMSRKYTRN